MTLQESISKIPSLTDSDLLAQVNFIWAERRRVTAYLVALLVEVHARNLWAAMAYSSLFDFCQRHLYMSEGTAYRHMTAAGLVARFPKLLEHIESGALHLSGLVVLKPHITEANLEMIIAASARKTVMQIKEFVARIAPKPDVPTSITELPKSAEERTTNGEGVSTPDPSNEGWALPTHVPASVPGMVRSTSTPLSEDRYKLEVTIGKELHEKLQYARDLMSHSNPSGDLAVIIDRAVGMLVKVLEREQLAKTSRPQTVKPRSSKAKKTLHVPAAVRREVYERDGRRCTYCDAEGRRCEATKLLQLDHIIPRALGGPDDVENLRVRCRAHNLFLAELMFGKSAVRSHFRHRKSPGASGG